VRLFETAFAKLNLALHVRRRRDDGYHDLETIFAFTELGDELTAEAGSDLTLDLEGPFGEDLTAEPDNLVLRAARALADAGGIEAGARLRLTKNLPVASGIGGGSADAAAALRLLNRLWSLDWPLVRLAALGARLGADVPACVHSRTMRGEGRGENLVPLDDISLQGVPALLANPRVGVSTAAVFALWGGDDRGPLISGDPLASARAGRNDLEPPARALAPAIDGVLEALAASRGVELARMSGSGATCFALFADEAARDAAATALRSAHPGYWVAPTRMRAVG
jgi:4-diphosphocytidyl-2-C-methyl-D-erythritol kinase